MKSPKRYRRAAPIGSVELHTVALMSTVVRPVGPEPPRTYWLRRIAVSVIAVLVIALVIGFFRVVLGGGDSGGEDQPNANDPVNSCEGNRLELAVAPSAPEGGGTAFGAGTAISLIAKVRNTGPSACSVDVGTAALELKVVSGSDRIYSSVDCSATEGESRLVVLQPGAEESTSMSWSGLRSADSCPNGLPTPRPGTYKVTVATSGVTSDPATFQLK